MKLFGTRRTFKLISILALATMLVGILVGFNVTASAATTKSNVVTKTAPHITGYVVQWGIYGGTPIKSLITNGTAGQLTGLNYAFGNIITTTNTASPYQCGSPDTWADYERPASASEDIAGTGDTGGWGTLRGNFHQLQLLKAQYPNIKIYKSIGGWTLSGWFSVMARTDASRKAFVASCVDAFIKGNFTKFDFYNNNSYPGIFDGIDLDWEYPTNCGDTGDPATATHPLVGCNANSSSPADKQNFTLLAKEFRTQLDAQGVIDGKHYLLSAALSAGPSKYSQLELNKLGMYLDYANLMGYDMHGAWEPMTNFGAPLRPSSADPTVSTRFTVAEAVQGYISSGFPTNKLVVGTPFYVHAWSNVPATNNGLYQSASANWAVDSEGYAALTQSADYIPANIHCDPVSLSWWLYAPNKNGALGDFTSFDPPASMTTKAHFINRYHLAGAMFWESRGDTGSGDLINALSSGLTDGASTMSCS